MGTAKEATQDNTPDGTRTSSDGWYVRNALDSRWGWSDKFGASVQFEDGHPFEKYGVNLRVLQPGQPNCYYHRESEPEDFLVISGECIGLIEGKEVPLKAWDFVHCAPGTDHVFVGAGTGPCLILMMGARDPNETIVYPVEPVALKSGAGVEAETGEPRGAYANVKPRTVGRAPDYIRQALGGR